MDSSAACWPSELEEMEEAARLIHESEWQLEMMRPFQFPPNSSYNSSSSSGSRSILISFKPKEEAVSDPADLIQLAPAAPYKSPAAAAAGGGGENVEAERKRRERLNQGFIHLSSLLPNLKKLDKASVLAEAASYVKQLQVRVKSLEQQTSRRESESITYVERSRISSAEDRDTSSSVSSDEDYFRVSNSWVDHLLEVEARILDKDVLIKVHCHRNQDMVPRVLGEIQKLTLDMINCNSMDFGQCAMVITILAKMNEEFSITAKNLVRILQQSLQAPNFVTS